MRTSLPSQALLSLLLCSNPWPVHVPQCSQLVSMREYLQAHPLRRLLPRLHGIKEPRWHDLVRLATVIVYVTITKVHRTTLAQPCSEYHFLPCQHGSVTVQSRTEPRPEQSQHVACVRMLETAGERTESSENAEERKARGRLHPRKRTLGRRP